MINLTNFHTHTKRCGHAQGSDRDYVLSAIKAGYTEIGFSDHVPVIFPVDDYYSNYRMHPSEIEDYANSVRSLKDEFKDEIKIYLGFEMEYFPKCFDDTLKLVDSVSPDFLILGQHYTKSEFDEGAVYSGSKTKSVEALLDYKNQVIKGAKTGRFLYIAHPDLINFIGDKKIYCDVISEMCKELKEMDIPIEANLLGFTDKRNYPNDDFWRIASRVKNKVIIGLDAHDLKVYKKLKSKKKLQEYIESFSITPIEINNLD